MDPPHLLFIYFFLQAIFNLIFDLKLHLELRHDVISYKQASLFSAKCFNSFLFSIFLSWYWTMFHVSVDTPPFDQPGENPLSRYKVMCLQESVSLRATDKDRSAGGSRKTKTSVSTTNLNQTDYYFLYIFLVRIVEGEQSVSDKKFITTHNSKYPLLFFFLHRWELPLTINVIVMVLNRSANYDLNKFLKTCLYPYVQQGRSKRVFSPRTKDKLLKCM